MTNISIRTVEIQCGPRQSQPVAQNDHAAMRSMDYYRTKPHLEIFVIKITNFLKVCKIIDFPAKVSEPEIKP